jgi:hypothetical protein
LTVPEPVLVVGFPKGVPAEVLGPFLIVYLQPNKMTDPYRDTTKQEENILFEARQRSRARVFAREVEAPAPDEWKWRMQNWDKNCLDYANDLIDELEDSGFLFGHTVGVSDKGPISPYMYDRHHRIWIPLYTNKQRWETLLRSDTSFQGVLEKKSVWEAFRSALDERCYQGKAVKLNRPLNGIPYSNGVFDFEIGDLRHYRPEDGRTFLGETEYVNDTSAPGEVVDLVRHMAKGDTELEELIYAAAWLHITGVHNVPTFKSGFFIWACPDGFSGRSALFDVINRASGGNSSVALGSIDDLSDPNVRARFEGRNYGVIDEANTVMSAKSKSMSILKQAVGGDTFMDSKTLYKDRGQFRGHWVISQALNSMSLIYAADRPLVDRTVAIVTNRIPQDAIERFRDNSDRVSRQKSGEEASAFVRFLWEKFKTPDKAAYTVDRLKGKYKGFIDQLADSGSPLKEFCGEALSPAPGKTVLIKAFVQAFNRWLAVMYPTNKQKTVRSITAELRSMGFEVAEAWEKGPQELCGHSLQLDTHLI